MNKRMIKTFALSVAVVASLGSVVGSSGCKKKQVQTPAPEIEQLSSPENVCVNDDYKLTFDAVENATSYQISIDDGDYIDIGNVTEYDLSDKYGQNVSVRALGDETQYKNSREVYTALDNYSQTFIDFEGAVGPDEWSGAGYGSAQQILGTTADKAHGGSNSLKMFIQNNKHYGGIMFDTAWYTQDNAIDWANVKEISYSSYIDTLDLEQIQSLCNQYGATYNAEVANVENVFGASAGGVMAIYYANDEGEHNKAMDVHYNGAEYPVNEWYTVTIDVTDYATITDICIYAGNSMRSFGFNNDWATASPYCYMLYLDDIKVTYNPIKLQQPQNLVYSDGVFSWDEVEYASGYEVSTDGDTWTRVNATEYEANLEEISQFSVRAVNGRKYADGTPRCETSYATRYATAEKAEVALTGEYDIDVINAEETLKIASLDGIVESITIGESTVDATYENGVLKADLSSMNLKSEKTATSAGELGVGKDAAAETATVTVTTDTTVYTFTATLWARVVSNATELQAMLNTFNAASSATTYIDADYCLDENIDATGLTTAVNKAMFCGIWDGKGRVISNLAAPNSGTSNGGIIYGICYSSTIKNIAFVGGTGERCYLSARMGGIIDNVYVEATIKYTTSYYGVFQKVGQLTGANDKYTIKNSVFNVTFTDAANANSFGGAIGEWTHGTLENVYAINNSSAEMTGKPLYLGASKTEKITAFSTAKGYEGESAFLGDNTVAFSTDNGWKSYWKLENGVLYFGDTAVLQVTA